MYLWRVAAVASPRPDTVQFLHVTRVGPRPCKGTTTIHSFSFYSVLVFNKDTLTQRKCHAGQVGEGGPQVGGVWEGGSQSLQRQQRNFVHQPFILCTDAFSHQDMLLCFGQWALPVFNVHWKMESFSCISRPPLYKSQRSKHNVGIPSQQALV